MTDAPPAGWIRLGRCGRPHGLRGEIWFTADNAECETLRPGLRLRLESAGSGAREVEVRTVRRSRDRFVLALRGVAGRTEAEALTNAVASVRREDFPPTAEGEFYHIDLIGLAAIGPAGEALGEVVAVESSPAHDLLVIAGDGGEWRAPMVEAWVRRIDLEAGRVELARSGEELIA